MDIREGDVFRFSYSGEQRAKLFEPYHCFDGQLVAVIEGGSIRLMDSYWLHEFKPRHDSRWFTEDDAMAKGELTFVCNLGDVQKVDKWQTQYYDDADVFDLSYQHRCYAFHAIRKGASKSKGKMLQVIEEKLQAERRAIESANWTIERLTKEAKKIEEGRLEEVYL